MKIIKTKLLLNYNHDSAIGEAFSNELQKYTRWLIQKTQEGTAIDKEK